MIAGRRHVCRTHLTIGRGTPAATGLLGRLFERLELELEHGHAERDDEHQHSYKRSFLFGRSVCALRRAAGINTMHAGT